MEETESRVRMGGASKAYGKKIALEVITPERSVLKDEVDSVVIPAHDGEYGILPGHTHFLAQLLPGELRIKKDGLTEYFAVSGGFAEVHPDRVQVFAETAEMAKEIDSERARLALEKAKATLSRAISQEELDKAQAALRRALMRLRVAEGLSRRGYKK